MILFGTFVRVVTRADACLPSFANMKSIKTILFLAVCHIIITGAAAAQETFDVVAFTVPKGWAKETSPNGDIIRYSIEDAAKNAFAMITIFKAVPAGADSKANFDAAWEEFAQKTLDARSPQMEPVKDQSGWEVQTGLAEFQKEGLGGAALLITASADSKMVNILLVTNTDIFQSDIESFFASVKLTEIAATATKTPANTVARPANRSAGRPELWMNRRIATSIYANPETLVDLYLIYPNGDYFPNVPYEGLTNVNRSFQSESWGRFTMQGNKGRFKSNYDDIAVTKRSATYMEKDGYSYGFYKFLPVDDVRIEGAYTHVSPDWGKDPQLDYLNGPGCQFTISFKKDGTFDDKGLFSTDRNNCSGGKGTYSIENFTITFRYSDGRVVHRLLTAPPTRDPATYDETIYIGHTAHYNKLR